MTTSNQSSQNKQISLELCEDGFHVKGELAFSSVLDLLEKGSDQINQLDIETINIKLDSVKRIDSAGISLLLSWKRDCQAANKKCLFSGISSQAKSLIDTYHLQSFLMGNK